MEFRRVFQRMFREVLIRWDKMSYYERFEQIVAMLLSVAVSITVVFAMYYLVVHVFTLLVVRSADPFDYRVFQAVFEMILTVLIALGFNHTIVRSLKGEGEHRADQDRAPDRHARDRAQVHHHGPSVLSRKFVRILSGSCGPWRRCASSQ